LSQATDDRGGVSVLKGLSGEPGRALGERAVHHGARVLLLLALATLITLLFLPAAGLRMTRYSEGMVAPEDVIAKVPFSVPKSAAELARDRNLAMQSVPPTFDYVAGAADTMTARLRGFFDRVDSAAAHGQRSAVESVLQKASVVATPSQVDALMNPQTRQLLQRAALTATSEFIPRGVADAGQTQDITAATVTVRRGTSERSIPAKNLSTQQDFFENALGKLPSSTPPDVANLLRLILIRHIQLSYVLDVVATELDRDAAARSVDTTKAHVLQGQAIVRAADPIGAPELARLQAYEAQLRKDGLLEGGGLRLAPVLGAELLNVMLLAIFGLLLFFFRREVYANFRWVLLIGLLVAVYFGAAAAIARNHLAAELLPIAFVGLPVGVLWDTRMALVLVLVLAGITGTLPPFTDYGTVLVVMAGGAAAAMSVRAVRRRSETWVSIAIIAGATALVLLGHGLATSRDLGGIARASAFAAGNATMSALLAIGFLWVFELFTGITTDQTLLEWADPTRPLLKRLSLEAPGTYAHSINVANLAEAAANAIGANGLLCRVGVYYHDVGKMLKPHYFVENQPDGRNPHDKLKPETSATIVREHVTEGVRLARDAKVPEVVVDFILEHHGTQRIGFFYEKALEEAEGELDETHYCYPGPRPRTRETAIVMLADSCESATRAMRDPTPERLRDLIRTVVRGKIDAGQLDDAPLTLQEVAEVEEQFVKIISGVMHRRIEYPSTKHLTDAPTAEDTAPEASTDAGRPGQ
jgi:putative nucleotidyltransferase with HDIG domain